MSWQVTNGFIAARFAMRSKAKGGEDALREFLGVSDTKLTCWLRGLQPIPESVFLKTVDVLQEQAFRGESTAPNSGQSANPKS